MKCLDEMRGDSEITLALGVNSHHEPRTTCRRHDWFQTSLPVIFTKKGLNILTFCWLCCETVVLKAGQAVLACAKRLADGCGLPDCAPLYPLAPFPAFFFFFAFLYPHKRSSGFCLPSPILKPPFYFLKTPVVCGTCGLWSPEPGAVRAVMKV